MEKIYRFTSIAVLARSHWRILLFFILGLFLLLGVRLHAESYTFGVYTDDEYHTVQQGLNLLVDGEVTNFRAQESVRWLVRAFYPYALVYLNTHMGGNVYRDGWSYPGHAYVVQHFVHQNSDPHIFSLDPNLRDLFHALRVQYIAFVCLCVVSFLYFFFNKKYYMVAFGGILLLGCNLDLITEQKIFYIEPGMLASLALMLHAYCYVLYKEYVPKWAPVLLGFLAAFMIATKFSTVLFALLPVIVFLHLSERSRALRHTTIYALSAVIFYILINFPAFIHLTSFNLFLQDLFSNFWQYAAGSDSGATVASGIPHLGLIVAQLEGLLGYTLYLFPILFVFSIYYANAKERMVLLPITFLTVLSVWTLSAQHVYLSRNIVPLYVPLAIVALLSAEIVLRKIASTGKRKYVFGGIAALVLGWSIGIIIYAGGGTTFTEKFFPSMHAGFTAELQILHEHSNPETLWYAVDFPPSFFSGETYAVRIRTMAGAPAVLNNENYPALIAQFSSLPANSVVLVNLTGNNKHITNYILPHYFNKNIQRGNYLVFFNAQ